MSDLVSFPLEGGGSVMVETVPTSQGSGSAMRGRSAAALSETATETLEAVLGRIGPAMRGVVKELRSSGEWPNEVELEFGVKLSSDANVIIARAGGEANFRITVRWSGDRPRA